MAHNSVDAGPSRLSVVSTPASGNQTLGGPDGFMIDGQEPGPSASTSETTSGRRESEPFGFPLSARLAGRRTSETVLLPPPPPPEIQIVKTANGRIVIEELDTPATRRRKAQRRREEKMRLAVGLAATSVGASEVQGEDQEAPLSTLTHASSVDPGERAPPVSSVSYTSHMGPGVPGPAAPESTMDNPASAVPIPGPGANVRPHELGAIRPKSLRRNEEESELSELSDAETQEALDIQVVKRRGRKPRNVVNLDIRVVPGPRPLRTAPLPVDDPTLDTGTVLLPDGYLLEGGTLGPYAVHPCGLPIIS